jgi:hypothetical protein
MKIKTILATALFAGLAFTTVIRAAEITPAEARIIVKEAYIYGEPIVDNYRVQYAYFVDTKSPEYKAPWNHIWNSARLFSPEDKAIQTANSDTLYSMIGADLRAEPIVLTIPKIEKGRYFSVQLIDYYTQNFDYIGSRTTGNEGGTYLLAGPDWKGETPKGIDKVFRSETELAFPGYRTQLFNSADLENVKKIQAGYKVQTLSAFLGQTPPEAAPTIDFIAPLTAAEQRTSPEFFNVLNFVLQFCPTVPSEIALMERFAKIGVGAGKTFAVDKLSPEMKTAIEQGMADAWVEHAALQKRIDAREVSLNRYLVNSPMLPEFKKDADGGLTLYVQNESPGADKESNWLPAPKGSFLMVMRLYWPKPEALEGNWTQPPLEKTE